VDRAVVTVGLWRPVLGTTSESLSITTTNANTFLIGFWSANNDNDYGLGSGFSALDINDNYQIAEYKIVSSSGTQTVNISDPGSSGVSDGVADAIVAASGGGSALASIGTSRKIFLPAKKKYIIKYFEEQQQ
jgi:hypothetical protein